MTKRGAQRARGRARAQRRATREALAEIERWTRRLEHDRRVHAAFLLASEAFVAAAERADKPRDA